MADIQPEFSNITGTATVTCLEDGRSASVPFDFTGSNEIVGPLRKGKPNGSTLRGSESLAPETTR